jgi:predicted ester cyclase
LDSLFAEGNYVASSGWTGVKAKHTGLYLGHHASGKDICFKGIDFWRSQSGKYVENWVFVDMIHLIEQMGIDLLNRLNFEGGR